MHHETARLVEELSAAHHDVELLRDDTKSGPAEATRRRGKKPV
jgi:hypothetical protein